ncbi:MAG: hypothetical protein J6S63_04460, partial [Atopobiaceae bacterium]|nr:hypothetical protein [Atopobiaceae bacterium]
DNTWKQNLAFGTDNDAFSKPVVMAQNVNGMEQTSQAGGAVRTTTDAHGVYLFDKLPVAYTDATTNQHYLAAYKVSLVRTEDEVNGLGANYLITRYHMYDETHGDVSNRYDSDVPDPESNATKLTLVDRDPIAHADATQNLRPQGLVILAKAYDTNSGHVSDYKVELDASKTPTGEAKVYDYTQARDDGYTTRRDVDNVHVVPGGDVGKISTSPQKTGRTISGHVWQDKAAGIGSSGLGETTDANGVEDNGEGALPNVEVLLTRYYSKVASDGTTQWVKDDDFPTQSTWTGNDGTYTFEGQEIYRKPTATEDAGVYAYRVELGRVRTPLTDEQGNPIMLGKGADATPLYREEDARDNYSISDRPTSTTETDWTKISNYDRERRTLMGSGEDGQDRLIVLAELADDDSITANTIVAPNPRDPNTEVPVGQDGKKPTSVTFDVAVGKDATAPTAGMVPANGNQTIGGTLFSDPNYNGLKDAGEEPMAGVLVRITRQVWDWVEEDEKDEQGQPTGKKVKVWAWREDVSEDAVSYLVTDANGAYSLSAPVWSRSATHRLTDADGNEISSTRQIVDDKGNVYVYDEATGEYTPSGTPSQAEPSYERVLCGYTVEVLRADVPSEAAANGELTLADGTTKVTSNDYRGVGTAPTTKRQQDSPNKDDINSKGVYPPEPDAEWVELAWLDDNNHAVTRTKEGKIVLAANHADFTLAPDGSNKGLATDPLTAGWDIRRGDDEMRMTVGFLNVPTVDIVGYVWDDANYNGIQDGELNGASTDDEQGIADQKVLLTQWFFVPAGATARIVQVNADGTLVRDASGNVVYDTYAGDGTSSVADASKDVLDDGTWYRYPRFGEANDQQSRKLVASQVDAAANDNLIAVKTGDGTNATKGEYRFDGLPTAVVDGDGN